MSKTYKRDKSKSMVDLAVAISIAPENCEGDNWGDVINLCGEADILIKQYEAELACLKSDTVKTMTLCQCGKCYRLPSAKVCDKCRITELEGDYRAMEALELDATSVIKGLKAQLKEREWLSGREG